MKVKRFAAARQRQKPMVRRLGTALCAMAVIALGFLAEPIIADADGPSLTLDADPSGNGPTHTETINRCISVAQGEDFQVDIVIEDVKDLIAWELYFKYDPSVLKVLQRNVSLFQAANSGSSVYDVSERVPDTDGVYHLAAADTADPASPDSGSGVLARLTLSAVAPGTTTISLATIDLNDDGKPDQGPFLRNADGAPIGDIDGDTVFDGPVHDATIAVEESCPPGSETTPEGTSGDGLRVTYVYVLAAGLVLTCVSAMGVYLFVSRRARANRNASSAKGIDRE